MNHPVAPPLARRPDSGGSPEEIKALIEIPEGSSITYELERQRRSCRVEGIEVIGHERSFGAGPSEDIKSRAYTNTGDTLHYLYELNGDTLTIWGAERFSCVLQGHLRR